MKLVIFGLTVSSSWGNGHATLWRALCGALARRGHRVVFFERDAPYYAAHRDLAALPGGALVLYSAWADARAIARRHLDEADVAVVTSYCPDAIAATEEALESRATLRVFYDMDTGVTLERLAEGREVAYVGPRGLADYDLVLSYTGGRALELLRARLGARRVAPLYGCVDPRVYAPAPGARRVSLSYLGTYAEDRQAALDALFLEPARRRPRETFLIGGSMYPPDFPWSENVHYRWHVPPVMHPAFYAESRLTLNVTRAAMARMGYCPSGRLFEAAACGTPILTDEWDGLDAFYLPGSEILVARTTEDALAAIDLGDAEVARVAAAAHERTLAEHTADRRAVDLERELGAARAAAPARAAAGGAEE